MEVCALASGSSGNCFYVGNDKSAILVDVGISAKQVMERLNSLHGDSKKIKGIFITHEHSDHIRGVDVLARKLNIPIFATRATLHKGNICKDKFLIKEIENYNEIKIEGLIVKPFSKSHSAADPVSYTIYGEKRVSVITDAGIVCNNIKKHVADCDFLFIESNHDEEMLENGPYPYFLKKWIKSEGGHLSNSQAAECIRMHASDKLKNIILSHLSDVNNNPDVALKTFMNILNGRKDLIPNIEVSSKERSTSMFKI